MRLSVRPAAALFALVSGAALLAACGGGSTPPQCAAPSGQVTLVYPAPGSTGIPDDFIGVIFASTNGLPATYEALLQEPGNPLIFPLRRVSPAATPLPSPNVVPPFPNPVYQESSTFQINKIQGGAKYQVYLNDTSSNCNPTHMGSFTLQ